MGFSDIGCYGGEIDTPNLNALAANGLRFTQFYNTARCSPSRASLLTGLHPHQVGVGILTAYDGPDGYEGHLNHNGVTSAEVLRKAGYGTYMSGKWHLTRNDDLYNPDDDTWPCKRGFDHHFGTLCGAGNYFSPRTIQRDGRVIEQEVRDDPDFYYTDAISDQAVAYIEGHFAATPDRPFFQYVAYTAPHWPLHAKPQDIAKYRGRFAAGWDALRRERLQRMIAMGLIDPAWKLTDRDPEVPAWENVEHKSWEERRMEVYAAQVDCMDQGIGRILACLRRLGQLDNTLVIFLADNGGCAEELEGEWARQLARRHTNEIASGSTTPNGRPVQYGNDPDVMPGDESTYQSYGVPWANLSNTPFRLYKHWTHEGGIATPFIVHWPKGLAAKGEWRRQPAQLTDVMATILDVTGAAYPAEHDGHAILPCEGQSLAPVFAGGDRDVTLFFEHEGNAAVRRGRWKLVKNFPGSPTGRRSGGRPATPSPWELYDVGADRTEMHDLAGEHPQVVEELAAAWDAWAGRCGVIPRERILDIQKAWRERQAGG
ncbi:MAG: arylsulfatase [Planctomycetes bacterium]|nr:arylsulfatase [Planctomycetota bacterium]